MGCGGHFPEHSSGVGGSSWPSPPLYAWIAPQVQDFWLPPSRLLVSGPTVCLPDPPTRRPPSYPPPLLGPGPGSFQFPQCPTPVLTRKDEPSTTLAGSFYQPAASSVVTPSRGLCEALAGSHRAPTRSIICTTWQLALRGWDHGSPWLWPGPRSLTLRTTLAKCHPHPGGSLEQLQHHSSRDQLGFESVPRCYQAQM